MKNLRIILGAVLLSCAALVSAQTFRSGKGTTFTARFNGQNAPALTGKIKSQAQPSAAPHLLSVIGDGTELWGSIVFANSWNEAYWKGEYVPFGYYAFKAKNSGGFEDLALYDEMQADGGAVILNDTLHLVHDVYGYGVHWVVYSSYDVKTWKRLSMIETPDFGLSAFDLALDPISGKVYGEFSSTDSDKPGFGTINFKTLEKDVVPMDTTFVGLSFNSSGQLYGVNLDGNLYSINKETGTYTKIGSTGLKLTRYRQSAAFDLATDKLYFTAQLLDDTSGLYEINTSTGKASLIKMFDDNQEVCGLMVPQRGVTKGSPVAATDMSVSFEDGSLTGNVKFTTPTQTMSGSAISSTLDYYVVANGDTLSQGKTQPGSVVDIKVTVPTAGFYRFDVLTQNSAGLSQPTRLKVDWIGYDTPVIQICNYTIDNATRKAELSWNVSERGLHNGYIDSKNLKYTVIRYPGKVVLGNGQSEKSFVEILPEGEKSLYSYAVVADNNGVKSDTIRTEELALGDYRSIPYHEDFATKAAVTEICSVIDSNSDKTTWGWSKEKGGCAVYSASITQYADDWLLTPRLKMQPNCKYNLSFVVNGKDGNRIQVKFGQGNDPTDRNQYKVIVKTAEVKNAVDTVINKEVEVSEEGYYQFAFHTTSNPNAGDMYLYKLKVEQRSVKGAPEKVTNIKVVPAAKGELGSEVCFNAPTKTNEGKTLSEKCSVEVRRNSVLLKRFDNLIPGQEVKISDNTPVNGYNTYTFVPFSSVGEGERDSVKVYIGQDSPCEVKNLRLVDNLDGTASLEWDPVDVTGKLGAYVDPNKVEYDVYYANYTQYNPQTTVVGKTHLDMELNARDFQTALYYTVRARNIAGESGFVESNIILEGVPYSLPFVESFPSGNYETIWWRDYAESDNSFRFNLGVSSDNDNGSIYWYPTSSSSEGEVNSGKIDISMASKPQLSFDYFALPGFDGQWEVRVCVDGKTDHVIWTEDFKKETGNDHWVKATVDLSPYTASKYVIIKFKAQSHQIDNHGMFLDNIRVENVNGHDLSVEMSAPKTLRRGKGNNVYVTVKNIGKSDEDDATLTISDGDKVIYNSPCGSVKVDDEKIIAISYIPSVMSADKISLTSTVTLVADEDASNNDASVTVGVVNNTYPRPEALNVVKTDEKTATVSWTAPIIGENISTDDIEDYSSWAISDFGDWTTYDGDKKTTYAIGNLYFPHSQEPYAFIVFNPSETGLDVTESANENLKPHSGEQYLACFDAAGAQNDDWLISPELSGKAQMVNFYAKNIGTVSGSFVEQFNVLYSTTGKEPEDFKLLTPTPVSAVDSWTEYTYNLPVGAVYFAIQVVSKDQFALLVDDITYNGKSLVLTGYNVYRNKKQIASVPADATSFTDNDVTGSGTASYAVSAVYSIGESGASDMVSVPAGITNIDNSTSDSIERRFRIDGVVAKEKEKGVQVVKTENGATHKVAL